MRKITRTERAILSLIEKARSHAKWDREEATRMGVPHVDDVGLDWLKFMIKEGSLQGEKIALLLAEETPESPSIEEVIAARRAKRSLFEKVAVEETGEDA